MTLLISVLNSILLKIFQCSWEKFFYGIRLCFLSFLVSYPYFAEAKRNESQTQIDLSTIERSLRKKVKKRRRKRKKNQIIFGASALLTLPSVGDPKGSYVYNSDELLSAAHINLTMKRGRSRGHIQLSTGDAYNGAFLDSEGPLFSAVEFDQEMGPWNFKIGQYFNPYLKFFSSIYLADRTLNWSKPLLLRGIYGVYELSRSSSLAIQVGKPWHFIAPYSGDADQADVAYLVKIGKNKMRVRLKRSMAVPLFWIDSSVWQWNLELSLERYISRSSSLYLAYDFFKSKSQVGARATHYSFISYWNQRLSRRWALTQGLQVHQVPRAISNQTDAGETEFNYVANLSRQIDKSLRGSISLFHNSFDESDTILTLDLFWQF